MMDLLKVTKRLYPTGRAFRVPSGSKLEQLHKALSLSEQRAIDSATIEVFNSLIADNDQFTEDDAAIWEARLSIISNQLTDLDSRKAAIRRKYFAPSGENPALQHYLRLQQSLQDAGFDLFVHENFAGQSPGDITPVSSVQHSPSSVQHGNINHGGSTLEIIANSILPSGDAGFLVGDLRSTFFIGADTLGDFANVPLSRQSELRQLILTLKPVQAIGYMLVNYFQESLDHELDFQIS